MSTLSNNPVDTVAPINTTAHATETVAAKAPAMRMHAIKAALPEFFAVDTPALVASLTDKGARIMALGFALAGCAVERAQSGNMPTQWADVQKACEALKGATKTRVTRALDIVGGVKPAHLKSSDIAVYADFAQAIAADIIGMLTPPISDKVKATPTNWKAIAEQCQAECKLLQSDIATLSALLSASGVEIPALTSKPATV